MTTMTSTKVEPQPMSAHQIVGHNVHSILWHRKINQRAFAAQIGISDSVLSKRLRGTSAWSAQDIADAAGVLGVEPGVFFRKVSEAYPRPNLSLLAGAGATTAPRTPLLHVLTTSI